MAGLQNCFVYCWIGCTEENADGILTPPPKKSGQAFSLTIVNRVSIITVPTQNSCLQEVEENLLWWLKKIRIKKWKGFVELENQDCHLHLCGRVP